MERFRDLNQVGKGRKGRAGPATQASVGRVVSKPPSRALLSPAHLGLPEAEGQGGGGEGVLGGRRLGQDLSVRPWGCRGLWGEAVALQFQAPSA